MAMSINLEALEQERHNATIAAMQEMTKIMQDAKVDVESRIKAARTIDALSDSLLALHVTSEGADMVKNTTNKLSDQLKKLRDEE